MADVQRRIDAALAALAAELELEGLVLDEDDQCLLEIDDQALLMQHFAEGEAEAVVLYVDLGPLAPRAERAAMRALLVANTSWRETGGGALGLAPDSGHATLMSRLDLAGIDPDGFVDRVGDLVEAAAAWRARLAEIAAADGGGEGADAGSRPELLIRA